jgi:shikimate kinase
MRIFLVGYMGSGKTSTGRHLARALNCEFKDLDLLFEEKYHITIHQFFQKYGEDLFRKLEHDLLKEHIMDDQVVLSMGGGTPCFYDNMDLMNRNGITVYIKMPSTALYNRLSYSKKLRPAVDELRGDHLKAFIDHQMATREHVYSKARLVVDGINLDVDELARIILNHNQFSPLSN